MEVQTLTRLLTHITARQAMWAGYIPIGLCAFWGIRLLARGIRGDVCDSSNTPIASRSSFITVGIFLLLLFIGYTLFVWKHGLFGT